MTRVLSSYLSEHRRDADHVLRLAAALVAGVIAVISVRAGNVRTVRHEGDTQDQEKQRPPLASVERASHQDNREDGGCQNLHLSGGVSKETGVCSGRGMKLCAFWRMPSMQYFPLTIMFVF